MTTDTQLYLTDAQYLDLLAKTRNALSDPSFKIECIDSTIIGNKFTWSNCGLCNDNFTTENTALFPDEFPERKTMKYRGENHKCPFDTREKPGVLGWGMGCFYECYVFKNASKKTWNLDLIRKMVEKTIAGGGENNT